MGSMALVRNREQRWPARVATAIQRLEKWTLRRLGHAHIALDGFSTTARHEPALLTARRRNRPTPADPVPPAERSAAVNTEAGDAGFTVVEVVVALAILALSLTVLFSVIAESLWNTANAETLSRAGMLAQSLLNRVGPEVPVRNGDLSGETGDGFRWRLHINTYASAETGQAPVGIYRVTAEVQSSGLKTQPIVLSTLRLGPREAQR